MLHILDLLSNTFLGSFAT